MRFPLSRPLRVVLLVFFIGGPLLAGWSFKIAVELTATAADSRPLDMAAFFSFGGMVEFMKNLLVLALFGVTLWVMALFARGGYVLLLPILAAAVLYWLVGLASNGRKITPRTRVQSTLVCAALAAATSTVAFLAMWAGFGASHDLFRSVSFRAGVLGVAVDGALLGALLGVSAPRVDA
jgi:hypothetical protein